MREIEGIMTYFTDKTGQDGEPLDEHAIAQSSLTNAEHEAAGKTLFE